MARYLLISRFRVTAEVLPAAHPPFSMGHELPVVLGSPPMSTSSRRLSRFAQPITKYNLEFSVFDGEGRTKKNVPLTKALDYGWACNINGTIQYGKGGNRS